MHRARPGHICTPCLSRQAAHIRCETPPIAQLLIWHWQHSEPNICNACPHALIIRTDPWTQRCTNGDIGSMLWALYCRGLHNIEGFATAESGGPRETKIQRRGGKTRRQVTPNTAPSSNKCRDFAENRANCLREDTLEEVYTPGTPSPCTLGIACRRLPCHLYPLSYAQHHPCSMSKSKGASLPR